jgi:hypothetical protein
MSSTKLESRRSALRPGAFDIIITSPPQPYQETLLKIDSVEPEGVITGQITIDGAAYAVDLGIMEGEHVAFRPHGFTILGVTNPLLYLFAGKVHSDGDRMSGRVIIPKPIVDPNTDEGLEASWTATRRPTDPDE